MKVLITQLARFGDIYQSWPTIRAVKRKYPDAEVHVLVRRRFASAMEGIGVSCQVHQMDTARVLEPIYSLQSDVGVSLKLLGDWVEGLKCHDFSEIINLSFPLFLAISCGR